MRNRRFVEFSCCSSVLLSLVFGSASLAAQVDAIWSGGTGTWFETNTANPHFVPSAPNNNPSGNPTFHAKIDGGNNANSLVDLVSGIPTVDALTIDAGDRLRLNNGTELRIVRSVINNAGEIVLNSLGSVNVRLSILSVDGTLLLSGGGAITMSNSTGNRINGGGSHLINVDNLIHGAGRIESFFALTNRGTIRGDQPVGLTIANFFPAGVINAALIESTSGNLQFDNTPVANFEGATPGTIRANGAKVTFTSSNTAVTGGTVEVVGTGEIVITSGAKVYGGVLQNSGTGLIRLAGNFPEFGGTVNNPVGGRILIENTTNATLRGISQINNAGEISIGPPFGGGTLSLGFGTVTLDGGGVLKLNGSGSRIASSSTIPGLRRLINQQHTIEGLGTIDLTFGNPVEFTNQADGKIHANGSGDLTILLPVFASSSSFSNLGTIRVESNSRLRLQNSATSFTNLSGPSGNQTITGGVFDLAGIFQFSSADIRTNASHIILDGPASSIRDGTAPSQDGLRNFATNLAAGHFTLKNSRNFTTAASLATFTNAGLLEVGAGSTFTHAGAGGLSNSGVIAGDGTVNATVFAQHGSALSPGSSPGTLTLDGLFTTGDMFLDWDLGITADKVVANNLLNFNLRQHTIRIIDAGGTPNPSTPYPLFESANGSIQNANLNFWTLDYTQAPNWTGGVLSLQGNQVVLTGLQVAVPEPTTIVPLLFAAAGFAYGGVGLRSKLRYLDCA